MRHASVFHSIRDRKLKQELTSELNSEQQRLRTSYNLERSVDAAALRSHVNLG